MRAAMEAWVGMYTEEIVILITVTYMGAMIR